ncbi:MAG: undecaprenyl-diphosphate phosphatase [Bacteroidales bacterium]|nr:undecaprenyl-diphosphate phosphatase [Bacteroidales bacterium]
MNWLEALLLGILQGLTEFLPVSSSGHLTIGQELLNLNTSAADNLLFTVTVHAATVLSTIVILWKEIENLFKGTFFTMKWNPEKEYVSKILLSIIPVMIVGLFFKDQVEAIFGSGLLIVGCCLLLTATLLTFAYYAKPRKKENISYRDAFIIGLGQALAVLPGLSRSGTTIATGLILGNKKESIAQFSFLMVLIPILGETFLNVIDMIKEPTLLGGIGAMPLLVGFLGAFISGCVACKFMINLVKKGKLIYFAIYCAIAGVITIIFAL